MEFRKEIEGLVKEYIKDLDKEYLKELRKDDDFKEIIVRDIIAGEVFYYNESLNKITDYIKEDDQFFYDCLKSYEFAFGEKIALTDLMEDPANLFSKVVEEGVYKYLSEFSNFKELEEELLEQKNESSMAL